MVRKKIRNYIATLNDIQKKIVLLRGFSNEDILLSQQDIAKTLNKSSSTINYNILKLRDKGYINEFNNLTHSGKLIFLKYKECLNNTKKLRAHNITGKLILEKPFKFFDDVRNKFIQVSNGRYNGFKLEFKGCIIMFYSKNKICFYLPDIYANDIPSIYAQAYKEYISPLESYLEQMFKGLKINKYEIASVTINHLAIQNHELAKFCKELNLRYVSDRIHVDHSKGIPELETVHKEHAVEDMDKILEYEDLIRGQ